MSYVCFPAIRVDTICNTTAAEQVRAGRPGLGTTTSVSEARVASQKGQPDAKGRQVPGEVQQRQRCGDDDDGARGNSDGAGDGRCDGRGWRWRDGGGGGEPPGAVRDGPSAAAARARASAPRAPGPALPAACAS